MIASARAALCGILALAASFAAPGAESATISERLVRVDGEPRLRIELRGPIDETAVARVETILDDVASRDLARIVVVLRSEGGSWQEAVALARLFRARHVGTIVPPDADCLSACAIAFLGGSARDAGGETVAARAIDSTARLGFHAPYLALRNRMFLVTDVERAYARAVESMLHLFALADELEIETALLTDLLVSGRDRFAYVDSVEEVARLGIAVSDAPDPPPLTDGAIRTYCTNAFLWQTRGTARGTLDGEAAAAQTRSEPAAAPPGAGDTRDWTRTLLPVAAAPGGAYHWCVFENAPAVAGAPPAFRCRGFVAAQRAEEVAARVRSAPAGWTVPGLPCDFPTAADPQAPEIDPRASAALAFHPADTLLVALTGADDAATR